MNLKTRSDARRAAQSHAGVEGTTPPSHLSPLTSHLSPLTLHLHLAPPTSHLLTMHIDEKATRKRVKGKAEMEV